MHDSALMRLPDRVREPRDERDGLSDREWARPLDPLLEGPALEERHHDERRIDARIEERHESVGLAELPEEARLAGERRPFLGLQAAALRAS